jgi:hypothetical protein
MNVILGSPRATRRSPRSAAVHESFPSGPSKLIPPTDRASFPSQLTDARGGAKPASPENVARQARDLLRRFQSLAEPREVNRCLNRRNENGDDEVDLRQAAAAPSKPAWPTGDDTFREFDELVSSPRLGPDQEQDSTPDDHHTVIGRPFLKPVPRHPE